jgi:hypothetical protein
VYKEHAPALRFIGKCYTNNDRDAGGGYGHKWTEWFQRGWFAELEKLGPSQAVESGYLGLMTFRSDGDPASCPFSGEFTYRIGLFFPAGTAVPDGFEHMDLPESDFGVAWIRGDDRTGEIYGGPPHIAAHGKLVEQGWGNVRKNAGGEHTAVFFERYNGPRFTTRDDNGNVTLDYGFYIE